MTAVSVHALSHSISLQRKLAIARNNHYTSLEQLENSVSLAVEALKDGLCGSSVAPVPANSAGVVEETEPKQNDDFGTDNTSSGMEIDSLGLDFSGKDTASAHFAFYYDRVLSIANTLVNATSEKSLPSQHVQSDLAGCSLTSIISCVEKILSGLSGSSVCSGAAICFIADLIRCYTLAMSVKYDLESTSASKAFEILKPSIFDKLLMTFMYRIVPDGDNKDLSEVDFIIGASYLCQFFRYGTSVFVFDKRREPMQGFSNSPDDSLRYFRKIEALSFSWLLFYPLLKCAKGMKAEDFPSMSKRKNLILRTSGGDICVVDRINCLVSLAVSMRCSSLLDVLGCLLCYLHDVNKPLVEYMFLWLIDDHCISDRKSENFEQLPSYSPLFANRVLWQFFSALYASEENSNGRMFLSRDPASIALVKVCGEWCHKNPRLLMNTPLSSLGNPLHEVTHENGLHHGRSGGDTLFKAVKFVCLFPAYKQLMLNDHNFKPVSSMESIEQVWHSAAFKAVSSPQTDVPFVTLMTVDFNEYEPSCYVLLRTEEACKMHGCPYWKFGVKEYTDIFGKLNEFTSADRETQMQCKFRLGQLLYLLRAEDLLEFNEADFEKILRELA